MLSTNFDATAEWYFSVDRQPDAGPLLEERPRLHHGIYRRGSVLDRRQDRNLRCGDLREYGQGHQGARLWNWSTSKPTTRCRASGRASARAGNLDPCRLAWRRQLTERRHQFQRRHRRQSEQPRPGSRSPRTPITLKPFYEKYGYSARLAYNWRFSCPADRRSWPMSTGRSGSGAYGQLDGSFTYTINDHYKIGLQATNLTESQYQPARQQQSGHAAEHAILCRDRDRPAHLGLLPRQILMATARRSGYFKAMRDKDLYSCGIAPSSREKGYFSEAKMTMTKYERYSTHHYRRRRLFRLDDGGITAQGTPKDRPKFA